MPLLVVQEYLGLPGLTVLHGSGKRAHTGAQTPSARIDVAQQVISAKATDHLVGAVSGEALGTTVPVHNPPLTIHKVEPVVHFIQELFVQGVVHGFGSASRYAGL
ncbi:MAG: hypothetical protein ACUVSY_13575 [Roseiflexus sp.]